MSWSAEHRPWPPPRRPWIMFQRWQDLLFAHWPVPAESLRPLIPSGLELDTFAGQAYIGVVPFRMSGIRVRFFPPIPGLSAFPELNVRTYVKADGKAGVWFFSLDARSAIAVATARRFFHLPYFNAEMALEDGSEWITYRSRRTHQGAPPAAFRGRYRSISPVYTAEKGSLDHWLTERYCLYTANRRGRLLIGEIHHAPWPLQRAEAEIEDNSMARSHGIILPESEPLLHFVRALPVRVWGLQVHPH